MQPSMDKTRRAAITPLRVNRTNMNVLQILLLFNDLMCKMIQEK